MSRTYVPDPLDTSAVELPAALRDLSERIAENVHEVWAAERLAQGWIFGPERNDVEKTHPCLVPYKELPESEKTYDRKMSTETLKMIVALGFRIELASES